MTDRLGSLGHRFWSRWTSPFLGLLEHRFRGRWTSSSSRLGLRRNVSSGFAERHHHLDRQEEICITWGRTRLATIFVLLRST